MVLRCTQKLLKVIGQPGAEPVAQAPDGEDWYANLLVIGRRKHLLLTHDATLFSVFEANVSAVALRDTQRLLADVVKRELAREGLPADTFGDLRSGDLLLAATADRQVLGCMNDMARLCEHDIAQEGGLEKADLCALNHALRRNINSARGYMPPIKLAVTRLQAPRRDGERPDGISRVRISRADTESSTSDDRETTAGE